MKQWKRLLSLVLAASLVFSMGIVLPEVQADSAATSPTETTWDFSSADGWTLDSGFSVADGQLTWKSGLNSSTGAYSVNNGQIAKLSDSASSNWLNYTISADITASYNNSQKVGNSATVNQHAMVGISFYVSGTDWVQVRVRPTTTENRYDVYVYENTTSSSVLYKNVVVGTAGDTLHDTAAFNLKVKYEADGTLTIYIDGTEVASATVTTATPGTPGLMAWCSASTATAQDTVTFDNVQVTPLAAPVVTPDYSGTVLGWSDGSATLGSDWTVTGTVTAENGVLKATTADNFTATVGSAVQHGYIEADVTLPAKSDFTATANKYLGYITATVGSNQVYILRLFWQQKSGSTTLHDGTLYADLFINDSAANMTAQYGGAAQGTRVPFALSDENWGKTYTLRLSRIGNYVEASVVDTATGTAVNTWQYALNPAYTIVTGPMTFAMAADTKDTGCTVTFDNVEAVEVNAYAVSAGELDLAVDSYQEIAAGLDGSTQDTFYRTAYAPGETVSVTLKSASLWDLDSLGYTTASNPAGAKLVATADETVYTFVMPNEAVTLVGEGVQGPANEVLYTNDGTQDLTTENWSEAISKTDKGLAIVTNMSSKNANKTVFYTTGMTDGWIKADITLPTITVDQMVANNGTTGNVPTSDTANMFYGFVMQDASNSSNKIEAAIFYQRNAGTTSAAQYSKLRVRCTGAGYDATNLAEIKLPNEIWDSSKTLTLMLRKVGNYVEAILIADGVEYVAKATAKTDTVLGSDSTNWKLGLFTNVGMLFTDNTKATKLDRTGYFTNIEVGQILRTVSVNVDSTAADKVSLPVVNEVGKTTALDRTEYQVGEIIALVVADGADISNLKYTVDDETEAKPITDPAAFEVPDAETKVIIVSQKDPTDETLYTSEGKTAITTADGWSADMTYNTEKGGFNVANSYYKTKLTDGWMSVTLKLPTLDPATIRTNNAGGDGSSNPQYCLIMRSEDGTARFYVDIMLNRAVGNTTLRFDIKEGSYTASRYYATENVTNTELNAIWNADKPLTVTIRKVGNYYEAVFTQDGNVICTLGAAAELTAGSTYPMANPDMQWMFGVLPNYGKLWADSSKTTTIDIAPYITKIEVGKINDTVAVTVDPEAQSQISLPSVNKLSSATETVERTAYQVGEKLELKLADGVNAANLKYTTAENTEGVAISNAAAFEVPNEDAITLTIGEAGGAEVPSSTVVATADGSATLDADIWAVTGTHTAENGVIVSGSANFSAKTVLPYRHGSIVADITLPVTNTLTANATVASLTAYIKAAQEHVARFQWANSSSTLQIGMLVRDEVNMSNTTTNPHYGGGGQGVSRGSAHNEAWGKTYTVELIRIGNLVQVTFTDKATAAVVESWTYNLNPDYEVTNAPMVFGFTGIAGVTFDNVVVTNFNANTVSKGELPVSVDLAAEIAAGMDGSGTEKFDRTHYAAGELVTVMVNDTTGLDLTTLRYTTATNTAGTALTATAVPGIYTFEMPNEPVTLVCDQIVVTEPSEVIATIDGSSNLDADLWTVTGAYTADGTISTTGSFSAKLDGKYQHFSMEADITVPAKSADLPTDSNVTLATMTATVGTNQHYTARFFWQGKVNTFYFDLFLNDANTALAPSIYGGAADGGRIGVALDDSHWGKTYTVRLSRIGNCLAYSVVETGTDNVIVDAVYNLNPNYTITTGEVAIELTADGSKGAVAFDNVTITSYNPNTVDKGELAVSLDSAKEHTGGKDGSGIEAFERTHYAAGELVTVVVEDPSGLDLSTLRFATATDPTGTTLTATSDPVVFTFVMPNGNVTLLCDEGSGLPIVPKPEGQVLKENFDAVANGTTADKIFKDMDVLSGAANAKAQDGALKLSSSFSMQTPGKYAHGYIQADITLEQPMDAMANATGTVDKYGGNLSAKWGGFNSSNNELRTRFKITRTPGAEKEYRVLLQLITYARVGDNNYGDGPIIHEVELTDFAWGNTYNVKLSVIGNYFTVHLDGSLVMAYSLPADSNIASYEGYFGMAHVGDGFTIAVDNLEIQSYKAYKVSIDSAMDGILKTDIYPDAKSGKIASRTHFLADEFVKLYVSAPAGYGIDDATIKYTGAECGEVAITAKDSAILYGFRMPAEDVTVSAALTEAEIQTNPINDTFDYESLMVDRGWGREFKILEGKARAYGYTESYLSGVSGSGNWQSYTVSAKITMVNTTSSSVAVAALCAKTDSAAAGYEFGLTFNAGATTGNLRLYDRANGEMLYTGEKELEAGVEYTLTMVVTGNRITGYLNGAWRFTVTVDDTVGSVGVRAQNANVIFDDVKVTDIVAK